MNIIIIRVIRGAFWKFLYYFSTFILNIALANYLGSECSGTFFFLLNNLGIAALIATFGLENTVSYYFSKKLLTKEQLIVVNIGWCAGITLVFISCLKLLPNFYDRTAFPIAPLFIYLYFFGATFNSLLNALEYAEHKNVGVNLIPALLNLSCTAFLFFSSGDPYHLSVPDVVVPILLIPFCSALILSVIRFKDFKWSPQIWKPLPNSFWNYGFKVYLASLFLGLFTKCDIWLIEAFCNNEELGNYIQTIKFAQLAQFIPLLASFSLFPSFTQYLQMGNLVYDSVIRFSNLYFFLAVCFCIGINFFSFWLFPFLYGPSFNLMSKLFLILTPGIIAFSSSFPFVTFFGASNRSLVNFKIAAESLLLLVGINLFFLQSVGIYGAAIAFSIANIFFLSRLLHRFTQVYPTSILEVFSFRTIKKAIFQIKDKYKR